MYIEVSTKCRKFENCRFVFTMYPNNACLKCDLICHEHTLLGSMTIEGPVIKDRFSLYVKEKAMTEDFVTFLFKLNIVSACKKVQVDGVPAYCCVLKRGLSMSDNKQLAVAFA